MITRLSRNVAGQGIVEFIFALPVMMMLFFGIFEFSRYYTARLRIRTAVAEAARFATTGNTLTDKDTGGDLTRSASIQQTILNHVAQFGVTPDDISIDPADGGGPEDVVTVSVNYDYQVAIPVMAKVFETDALAFSVSTTMRNEPFFE